MTSVIEELKAEYEPVNGFYGKAYVVSINDDRVLVSYKNPLVAVNKDGGNLVLSVEPRELTPTALRHVREFLKQNGYENQKLVNSEIKKLHDDSKCEVNKDDARFTDAKEAFNASDYAK